MTKIAIFKNGPIFPSKYVYKAIVLFSLEGVFTHGKLACAKRSYKTAHHLFVKLAFITTVYRKTQEDSTNICFYRKTRAQTHLSHKKNTRVNTLHLVICTKSRLHVIICSSWSQKIAPNNCNERVKSSSLIVSPTYLLT